jgi:hypothetical protein
MAHVSVLGIDLAKQVFPVVGMHDTGTMLWRKRLTRSAWMPLMGYVRDTCLCRVRHKHVYPAHQIMPRSSLARVVHPWKHTVARLPYAP